MEYATIFIGLVNIGVISTVLTILVLGYYVHNKSQKRKYRNETPKKTPKPVKHYTPAEMGEEDKDELTFDTVLVGLLDWRKEDDKEVQFSANISELVDRGVLSWT